MYVKGKNSNKTTEITTIKIVITKKKEEKSIPIKKINMQDVYNMNNKFEDINSNSIKATESNFSKTTDRFPIHSLNLKE